MTYRSHIPHIELRERTNSIQVETSYCQSCKVNHWKNIGTPVCVACGKDK